MSTVVLRVFSAFDLPVVLSWFAHPDQREFARDPPARELEFLDAMPGSEYRGARVRERRAWIAVDKAGSPSHFSLPRSTIGRHSSTPTDDPAGRRRHGKGKARD